MDSSSCLTKTQDRSCETQPSYNPFEVDICSLSLPACSPDAFSLTKKVPKKQEDDENSDKSFRWSIGQVAMLNPANLDEDSYQNHERWDEEKEYRAQKAIQTFFLHNSVCPSPWNDGAMNFKHVTFSPNLASTAYYSRSNSPLMGNSETSESAGKKDVWTQTMLAIPMDVDIFQLLGHFFTFLEDQREQRLNEENYITNDTKDLSNSSLRRKLFSPSSYQKDHSSECGTVQIAISPLKFFTPEKVPLLRTSPSSAGTYFSSSSPISTKNCTISPDQMERNLSLPTVSPILTEKQKSSIKKGEINPHLKWHPSTPCTKKGARLKSIQPSMAEDFTESMEKQSPQALTVSMESKGGTEEQNGMEELQMDDDHLRYDLSQSSEMQVSIVQFSREDKIGMQSAGISGFHPSSVLSQDTGYKTESYQFSLDQGSSTNINESKEKMVQHWLSNDYDSNKCVGDNFHLQEVELADYADSVLVSQSKWQPCGFSTPH